ncbi:ArsR/SmtB family transcription factor [Thalassolituus sp. LLYu03]|uniref:ArsR/SmtB family transcription factor n=1 Tax=Thalassolituus sp. LLYu03 TaxID=3421656 RepID=UPI003D2AF72C
MCRIIAGGVDRLADAFKALAHANRLQIYLEVVAHHQQQRGMPAPAAGCGVADFMSKLSIGAPTVSHHVKALVDAGLIRVEKQGKFLTCYLNESLYNELGDFFRPKPE